MGPDVSDLLNCFCRQLDIYQDILDLADVPWNASSQGRREESLRQVWCLLLVLFMAELKTVFEINDRCA